MPEAIKNLMDTMKWTAEQVMAAVKIPDADREEIYGKAVNHSSCEQRGCPSPVHNSCFTDKRLDFSDTGTAYTP